MSAPAPYQLTLADIADAQRKTRLAVDDLAAAVDRAIATLKAGQQ